MLSPAEQKDLEDELVKYDRKPAAAVEALKILQKHRGWISDDALCDLASFLAMTPDELDGLATFYPFIFRRPVGRHIIYICDSVVCWIMGYAGLIDDIRLKLGINPGETTQDSRFTLLPVSCMGRCDHAPVLMIDSDMHQNVDRTGLEAILEKYK